MPFDSEFLTDLNWTSWAMDISCHAMSCKWRNSEFLCLKVVATLTKAAHHESWLDLVGHSPHNHSLLDYLTAGIWHVKSHTWHIMMGPSCHIPTSCFSPLISELMSTFQDRQNPCFTFLGWQNLWSRRNGFHPISAETIRRGKDVGALPARTRWWNLRIWMEWWSKIPFPMGTACSGPLPFLHPSS